MLHVKCNIDKKQNHLPKVFVVSSKTIFKFPVSIINICQL